MGFFRGAKATVASIDFLTQPAFERRKGKEEVKDERTKLQKLSGEIRYNLRKYTPLSDKRIENVVRKIRRKILEESKKNFLAGHEQGYAHGSHDQMNHRLADQKKNEVEAKAFIRSVKFAPSGEESWKDYRKKTKA